MFLKKQKKCGYCSFEKFFGHRISENTNKRNAFVLRKAFETHRKEEEENLPLHRDEEEDYQAHYKPKHDGFSFTTIVSADEISAEA